MAFFDNQLFHAFQGEMFMPNSANAIADWNSGVKALMQDNGLTQARAVRELAITKPDLHRAYIAAFNATSVRPPSGSRVQYEPSSRSPLTGDSPNSSGDAIADWHAAVERLMADRGFTKPQATRALCIENPELQKAFNCAYEAKFGAHVRSKGRESVR